MKINANSLKQALTVVLSQRITDVTIECKEHGWLMKAMDPSHVAFVKAELKESCFEDYAELDNFTVDPEKFAKAIKYLGSSIEFSLDGGMITMSGNGITSRLSLLAPVEVESRVREMEFPATAIIDSTRFKQILKVLGDMSSLNIEITEEGLAVDGYKEDGTGSKLELDAEGCVALAGQGRAEYPMSILSTLNSIMPDKVELEISMGDNFPCRFQYTAEGTECALMCAPWIEEGN